MITADSWRRMSGIRHGFSTRRGGVSDGVHASLNCGFGSSDDPARVRANRDAAVASLGFGPASLVTVRQIHSPIVVVVDRPWEHGEAPEGDALVTRQQGIALGILTADCVPVLFADPDRGVIGAAHAGWKGALGGVVETTLAAMLRLGADMDHIRAATGPAIQRQSYEVGEEFRERFAIEDARGLAYLTPGAAPGRHQFDLPGYVAARLRDAGVRHIDRSHRDTLSEPMSFFSYRRSVLRGEPDFGRHISLIAMAPGRIR